MNHYEFISNPGNQLSLTIRISFGKLPEPGKGTGGQNLKVYKCFKMTRFNDDANDIGVGVLGAAIAEEPD